ncbi:amidohydrolase [Amycolatopsis acidicola]|uniref:Amidohydrolase n=1 Tax=Amycolatopsis acidicola TaxID=2596893 RepID=A0A5N0VKJ7_9PSEU|nr:amidohydrolase family protein [Amycolatopsis acidicola]KAA9166033.1 amidohydrolase [Amycolatopsis acidicola]
MLDVHTHFFPRDLPPPSDQAVREGWPVLEAQGDQVRVFQRGKHVRTLGPSAWDAGARFEDMDRDEVVGQVVMPTPFTFLYDASAEIAGRYAREQNDRLAELIAAGQGRLFGLGAIPLQDPEAAVAEIKRLPGELGMHGVAIGTHAHRFQLHDKELDPVFAELEASGSAVFVHPWQPVAPERSCHHGLAFGLGRAIETELAVGSLLFGGVLDRHPALRICLAHGGAGVPALRGRLLNGWQRQHDAPPRDGPWQALRTLWADGLTYDPGALALAEDTFGPEHMVVGSDYPFAAMESPIAASYRLGAESLRLGGRWRDTTTRNALDFLGCTSAERARFPSTTKNGHAV